MNVRTNPIFHPTPCWIKCWIRFPAPLTFYLQRLADELENAEVLLPKPCVFIDQMALWAYKFSNKYSRCLHNIF